MNLFGNNFGHKEYQNREIGILVSNVVYLGKETRKIKKIAGSCSVWISYGTLGLKVRGVSNN